jgi:hypothetical protein
VLDHLRGVAAEDVDAEDAARGLLEDELQKLVVRPRLDAGLDRVVEGDRDRRRASVGPVGVRGLLRAEADGADAVLDPERRRRVLVLLDGLADVRACLGRARRPLG